MRIGIRDAAFSVGELVWHRIFDYRGVVIDVDPVFMGDEEWYEQMAMSRLPKDRPWYRVLVHNAVNQTYVAERNLNRDDCEDLINHPAIDTIFSECDGERYKLRFLSN